MKELWNEGKKERREKGSKEGGEAVHNLVGTVEQNWPPARKRRTRDDTRDASNSCATKEKNNVREAPLYRQVAERVSELLPPDTLLPQNSQPPARDTLDTAVPQKSL